MNHSSYYHVCADGADAKNFIICIDDYRAAFNLIGVCAANCNVIVVAFSIEDSHPHFLLYGCYEDCLKFKQMFEASYKRYVVWTRGSLDGLILDCVIYDVETEDYLMNVGTYVIVQATKDGKRIMPYDYPWGSGSMYFRPKNAILPWRVDDVGNVLGVEKAGDYPEYVKTKMFHSTMEIPDEWLICNGLILPENYIDVGRFESIYKTHNCFRVFLSSGKNRDAPVIERMAQARGITLEDLEIRKRCGDIAKEMFGTREIRKLKTDERLRLAMELRRCFYASKRQIATVVCLPLTEIEKYIR